MDDDLHDRLVVLKALPHHPQRPWLGHYADLDELRRPHPALPHVLFLHIDLRDANGFAVGEALTALKYRTRVPPPLARSSHDDLPINNSPARLADRAVVAEFNAWPAMSPDRTHMGRGMEGAVVVEVGCR